MGSFSILTYARCGYCSVFAGFVRICRLLGWYVGTYMGEVWILVWVCGENVSEVRIRRRGGQEKGC